jgi:hypothetical protein
MKQNPKEPQYDIKKIATLLFLAIWVSGMLFFFALEATSPSGKRTPVIPEFTFSNVGPCLEASQDIVERFTTEDQQYVCADMKTDESTVYLELHVFTKDSKDQVYVDGSTFTSGPISFAIDPPLPPGKYWAYISWSKPALVDFEFEVTEK